MYAGLTLEEIAGRGVRWPEREHAAALPAPANAPSPAPARSAPAGAERRLLLSSYRSLWSFPEVAASPALAFLHPPQRVEISPADARSLGLAEGEHVVAVDSGGASVAAVVAVRDAVPAGRAIMLAGLAHDGANALRGELVELREPPPTPPEPAEDAADEEIEEALV